MKTGAPGKLFKSIKFHLFGIRDTDVEQIEIQHNLRKQIKKNIKETTKQSDELKNDFSSPISKKQVDNAKSKDVKGFEYIYNKT